MKNGTKRVLWGIGIAAVIELARRWLNMPPEKSLMLMTGRYNGDEGKKDIHEGNLDYLNRSRMAANYCSRKLGWQELECCGENGMRSIEAIQEEILALAAL